jgi:SSS family solute:Na+ symporter
MCVRIGSKRPYGFEQLAQAGNRMNLDPLDVIAVAGYFALMGVLGYLTRRNKTFREFAVGGHSVPATMIFASLAATIIGPGFSVGITSKSWGQGFLIYFLTVTFAVQTLLSGFLFAPRLAKERDCNTLGDVMRKRYGRFTQLLTGILSVGLCIGFTAVMGKIGGIILHGITNWPLVACIIAVTGTTALLTFTGGLRATIATEGVQFSLKAIIVPAMLLLAVQKSSVPLAELSARAGEMASTALGGMTAWQVIGIAVSFMLGELLIPPYANRALAAKSEAASKSGFLLAGGFVILWLAIVAALGIVARGVLPSDTSADDVFVAVGRAVLPPGVFGLLLATLVAIVMASQESVLNSSAVAFVRDIVTIFAAPGERVTLVLAKVSTLVIAALAIFVAQYAPSIIDGLLILYAIWAPSIIVSLVAALFLKNPKPLASWMSILGGAAVSLVWQLSNEPGGVPAILVGLAASLLLYAIGHQVGRPLKQRGESLPATPTAVSLA